MADCLLLSWMQSKDLVFMNRSSRHMIALQDGNGNGKEKNFVVVIKINILSISKAPSRYPYLTSVKLSYCMVVVVLQAGQVSKGFGRLKNP